MTWLKLSDDFGDECARADLSDAAFRTHVEGLLWTMRRESGGRLTFRDLRRFAESIEVDSAVKELLKRGFWTETGDGYVIEHGMDVQVEPEVIAQRRRLDAERQRRARFKKAQLDLAESAPVNPSRRDKPRDNTRDPGLGWSGRDRKTPDYVAPKEGEGVDADQTEEDWPTPAEPGSGVPDTRWADEHFND